MLEPRDATLDARYLGRYDLLGRLAVGGMAEIYLARAHGISGFEKLLVLKRILPQHALDPQLLRMFLDEARLGATLDHPNITQVYDVGLQGETPFFTMEYVHGANLREILRAEAARASAGDSANAGTGAGADADDAAARPLPDAVSIGIIAAAAAGLHHAHEKRATDGQPLSIVHRDVSPSNVLVTYDGTVKVTDFGIAKWSSQRTQTQAGALKGKFAYMSPEQCRGEPVDRRSDVFSLGTLLYELTAGAPPFRGASDYEILNQIATATAPVPLPARAGAPYPPALARIVLRSLAPAAADRYPTAQALQLDLEEFARAHGLSLSAVSLAEYMRGLFGDRIAAWEAARRAGRTLGEHLGAANRAPDGSAAEAAADPRTATDIHAGAVAGRRETPAAPTGRASRWTGARPAVLTGTLFFVALAATVIKRSEPEPPAVSRPAPADVHARSAVATTPSPAQAPPARAAVTSTARRAALTVSGHPPPSHPAKTRSKRGSRRRAEAAAAPAHGLGAWDPDSAVPPR
ncbi:MAG TPA: serine/threonine-protein kinase [Polyangia bacterium]|nr:serine/threonine-protein kinase [Polyangia bacterium]